MIAGIKAMRTVSLAPVASDDYRLPVIPIFVWQGDAVKEVVPLAGRGYSVGSSHFEEINLSQQRAVQNVFDYQVSLIHAPSDLGRSRPLCMQQKRFFGSLRGRGYFFVRDPILRQKRLQKAFERGSICSSSDSNTFSLSLGCPTT